MSIANLLVHRLDVQSPTMKKFGTGANKRVYPPDGGDTPYSDEPCRIEPLAATKVVEFQKLGVNITHKIYFGRKLTIDNANRLKFGTRFFEVRGFHDTDELNRLFVVDAEEKGS
jgi:hypothetical protein